MKRLALLSVSLFMLSSCSSAPKISTVSNPKKDSSGQEGSVRLAKTALRMLDPEAEKYNPEKGKNYLEFSLKQGNIKSIEVPAHVLLALLREGRVAEEKTHNLEQQLEIMKEIDLNKPEGQ